MALMLDWSGNVVTYSGDPVNASPADDSYVALASSHISVAAAVIRSQFGLTESSATNVPPISTTGRLIYTFPLLTS